MTTDESLKKLFSRRGWHRNSGINGSTARVYKKRFFEGKLELETRIKILEACGYKVIQEMKWAREADREHLRENLISGLKRENVFWSYEQPDISRIPDEVLIEKVLMHLDSDDIDTLFILFPKKQIKKIWKAKMLSQEPVYHNLNRLYSFLYFDIKDPDRFITDSIHKKLKSLSCVD